MKKLLVLGAGHYAVVVYEIAQNTGMYENIDFLDDNIEGDLIVGKLSDCEKLIGQYESAVVAIGNAEVRQKWLHKLHSLGYELPVLAHTSAVISPSAKIGYGTIIEPLATIQANVSIGVGCLICSGAVLKHNSVVKNFCYIDCNSTVMPDTIVSTKTRVNANSVFFQQD